MSIVSPLPLPERISQAVKTTLQAIVSDGSRFSFTPDAGSVAIVEDLNVARLDSRKQLVYWILEGDHKPSEEANYQFGGTTYLSVFAAYRYPVPQGSAPDRSTLRNLLASDIHRALTQDVKLGLATGPARVVNTEVTEISRDLRIDSTVEWIAVSAFVVVTSKEERFPA